MPFRPEMDPVYSEIRTAVETLAGLTCLRADQLAHPTKITDDIWEKIQEARFIIADITGSNPNVFYEIGLCHAIGKPVILLAEASGQVPFDISGIRHLGYSRSALNNLRTALVPHIRACLECKPDATAMLNGRHVRIDRIQAPSTAVAGEPLRITIKARNEGTGSVTGYFSVSLPSSSTDERVVESDLKTKIGGRGTKWKGGQVILDYPILEAYESGWPRSIAHHLTVELTPTKPGLFQYYVSASSNIGNGVFVNDPVEDSGAILDQRDEPVYCGVIGVVAAP
jgi:hypothetical protein